MYWEMIVSPLLLIVQKFLIEIMKKFATSAVLHSDVIRRSHEQQFITKREMHGSTYKIHGVLVVYALFASIS